MIPIKNFTPIGVDPELPVGYTACEYLESTGTQYLPDIILPYDFTAEFVVIPTILSSYHNIYDDLSTNVMLWLRPDLKYELNINGISSITYASKLIELKVIQTGSTHTLYVDGELATQYTGRYVSSQSGLSVSLFHRRTNGQCFVGKIVRVSIYDQNSIQTLNLLPSLDPSGVPCMYDTVSKKTYYNSGTGNFSYKTIDRGSVYLYDASDFVKGECYTMYGNTSTSTFGKSFLDGKTHNGTIYAGNEPTGQYSPVRWTCSNYHILDHLIIGNDVTGTSAASVYGITDDGTYELIGEGPKWTGTDTIVMTKFKPYKKFEIRCHRPGWTNRVYVYWIDAYMRY